MYEKLLELYNKIPPRQPRGHPQNIDRMFAWQKFESELYRLGLEVPEALEICQEKRESGVISPSI